MDTTIGNSVDTYTTIMDSLRDKKISFEEKFLFQTDLYPTLSTQTLDKQWAHRVQRLITFFNKITSESKESSLDRFKSAFSKRYETREMPLTTVLDTEVGIGYIQNNGANDATPFLDGLQIPYKGGQEQQYTTTPFQRILEEKLEENTYSIEITDQDVKDFDENWNDLPDTMSAMVQLVRIDGEEKAVLGGIGGSSAANLLGRFTTGDQEVFDLVKEITDVEQRIHKNHILAEIIHLPESRTGNVIRRETLREYEIPYLGKASVDEAHQIPIEDLMISVQRRRVLLRSKKHNKYVIPRLSNAHNYSANALPIYHFLCDLQKQAVRPFIGFGWSTLLQKKAFLPRVTYKDFILSKARWVIRKKDITELQESDPSSLVAKVTEWRNQHNMPQMVQLVDNDNTLLIDLNNELSIQMWLDTVKKRSQFTLEEFLFTEDAVVKRGDEGFTNQMVFCYYNQQKLEYIEN